MMKKQVLTCIAISALLMGCGKTKESETKKPESEASKIKAYKEKYPNGQDWESIQKQEKGMTKEEKIEASKIRNKVKADYIKNMIKNASGGDPFAKSRKEAAERIAAREKAEAKKKLNLQQENNKE